MTAAPWRIVAPGAETLTEWQLRPVTALRVVILLLIVGQLGRIPVLSTGTSEAPLLVNDICLLAVIAIAALAALARRSFKVDAVGLLMFAFATIGFVSALMAVPRFGLDALALTVSLAYLARWLVYFALYLVIINVVRGEDVGAVWRSLESMMIVFVVFGIFQSIFLPHFAQLVYPDARVALDWDEQGHRLVSTMLEPNIAGSMIMFMLLIYVGRLSVGEPVPMWKPLLFFAALVATLSRSSFLGLAVGGLIIVAIQGVSRRLLRFGTILGVLILVTLPQLITWGQRFRKFSVTDDSAMSRVIAWIRAAAILADHPIFGVGFNTFGYVAEHYGGKLAGAATFGSDGGLLFIASMVGFVGLACYVGMLCIVVRRCRRIWRSPDASLQERGIATGIAAVTVAACVTGSFVNCLLTPFTMEMLWIFWALAFVMHRGAGGAPPRRDPVRLVACRTSA